MAFVAEASAGVNACRAYLILIRHLDLNRTYLNISADDVPNTLKKSTRALERAPGGGDRPPRRFDGDRPRRDFGEGGGELNSSVTLQWQRARGCL